MIIYKGCDQSDQLIIYNISDHEKTKNKGVKK